MTFKADEKPATTAESKASESPVFEALVTRLERLVGTGEGSFLLALHSFVESFNCDVFSAARFSSRSMLRLDQSSTCARGPLTPGMGDHTR
jgi:hypothetical protein